MSCRPECAREWNGTVGKALIRIDSLYVLLPNRLRLALDFAGLALFTVFFGLIAALSIWPSVALRLPLLAAN